MEMESKAKWGGKRRGPRKGMKRACRSCGIEFEYEYEGIGRFRNYCPDCRGSTRQVLMIEIRRMLEEGRRDNERTRAVLERVERRLDG